MQNIQFTKSVMHYIKLLYLSSMLNLKFKLFVSVSGIVCFFDLNENNLFYDFHIIYLIHFDDILSYYK